MTGAPGPDGDDVPSTPAIGAVVRDAARDRIGVVMDNEGPGLQLRPLGGGREWAADPSLVQLLSSEQQLSARVAEANLRSRTGLDLGGTRRQPQDRAN